MRKLTATRRWEFLVSSKTAESPAVRSDRVHALALDIAHRLHSVCAHMPQAELMQLATQMARTELHHFGLTPLSNRVINGRGAK